MPVPREEGKKAPRTRARTPTHTGGLVRDLPRPHPRGRMATVTQPHIAGRMGAYGGGNLGSPTRALREATMPGSVFRETPARSFRRKLAAQDPGLLKGVGRGALGTLKFLDKFVGVQQAMGGDPYAIAALLPWGKGFGTAAKLTELTTGHRLAGVEGLLQRLAEDVTSEGLATRTTEHGFRHFMPNQEALRAAYRKPFQEQTAAEAFLDPRTVFHGTPAGGHPFPLTTYHEPGWDLPETAHFGTLAAALDRLESTGHIGYGADLYMGRLHPDKLAALMRKRKVRNPSIRSIGLPDMGTRWQTLKDDLEDPETMNAVLRTWTQYAPATRHKILARLLEKAPPKGVFPYVNAAEHEGSISYWLHDPMTIRLWNEIADLGRTQAFQEYGRYGPGGGPLHNYFNP